MPDLRTAEYPAVSQSSVPHDASPAASERDEEHHLDRVDLARIGFVALAVVASWAGLWKHFARFDFISLFATLIGGYPIFHEAFQDIVSRRMTMELSMTIALVAAMAIREFRTALIIALFVIAEVLEGITVSRGRTAIRELLDALPTDVVLIRDGMPQSARAADLKVGDVVLVKPGSRIPADGVVVGGYSFVDQATITGESMPSEKKAGTSVFAGTVNQSGALEFRVTRLGRDTAYGKIIQAVESAEQSRAPIQKTADRLAGWLVYFAIACAILTFLLTHNMRSTISVIIVAGACGIAAGTPLAILGAIGRAARTGAIIKGGLFLEALGSVDTIVFDKTGTVTLGKPRVVDIRPEAGCSTRELLQIAAAAEHRSEHPVAVALLEKARQAAVPVVESSLFLYTPGKGVTCSIDGAEIVVGSRACLHERGFAVDVDRSTAQSSEILVAKNGTIMGSILISDALRPEATHAIRSLRELGIRTILLTGDSGVIARAVAKELGVDEVDAELLPDQKLQRIRELLAQGKKVGMVGDGVNDAPALMQATVGIAMGSGTDVARESADIVLLGNDLSKVVETVKVARRCRRIILANFAGTLSVDALGVGLAAFGFLNPLLAAFIHVSSELAFILNSARLLPVPRFCDGGHP